MAKQHKLELNESEIQALVELRDKGEPAYLRERATALLKIHQGHSPHEVARKGLLKTRDPDTVYAWLRRYREHGISGLSNKPGRGRKPAFSPKSPEAAESETLSGDRSGPGTRQSAANALDVAHLGSGRAMAAGCLCVRRSSNPLTIRYQL